MLSGSEESEDENDFIVDDNDEPIGRVKKKRGIRHKDEAMQQAQDIFGVDFDFEDLQNVEEGEDYDEEEGDEEDEYDESGEVSQRRSAKKKSRSKNRKSIFELYEPSELERSHMTEKDDEIRKVDVPERFQLRSIPVTSAEDDEIEEEAEWIWKQAFSTSTISIQGADEEDVRQPIAGRKPSSAVPKIREALNFMRKQLFEVPFIAFYRKEYVEPELNINDLWTVFKWDERWCQLQIRKRNMTRLLKNMQSYQIDRIVNRPQDESPDPIGCRTVSEREIERVRSSTTFEELKDCWVHFQLHYGNEIPSMKQFTASKQRGNRHDDENNENDFNNVPSSSLKIAQRRDKYVSCRDAGIGGMAAKFGLTAEQFGENLRDNYARHDVEQSPEDPLTTAEQFVCPRFGKAETVVAAAKYMIARQIAADPLTRKCLRQTYFERAKIHVRPTKKGKKEIDENHPCYSYKYVRNKAVGELRGDQYLQLHLAKEAGMVEIRFSIDTSRTTTTESSERETTSGSYVDEIKQLFEIDEYSELVQSWNDLRHNALRQAFEQFLYPHFEKELRARLLQECYEHCLKSCCHKLYNWLKVGPYTVHNPQILEDEDFDTRDGIRVLALSFVPSNETPAFAALLDADGLVIDYIRLPYFLLKRQEYASEKDRQLREKDRNRFKDFIVNKKPHVIAVGSETLMTRLVIQDVHQIVTELVETEQFPLIPVELVDNEVALVFQESKRAATEFHDFPALLRQAVSLGRRLLDPLIEFSQLCTPDEEVMCLKYHPMQEHLNQEELLNALQLEFVNRVNQVGIDINRCLVHPHTAQLVQFICGLGQRKGAALLRTLKKHPTPMLESRTQIVTNCGVGAKVFINCVGFIKIDTAQISETGTDTYIEVLDSTRVHPEAYEWARKMAVDALEYDDQGDSNPAGALEEILENPDKLKDLDLDAFAEELERQGFGNKSITLYDIREELNCRYKDLREAYQPPSPEQIFHLLTRETPQSFHVGKLVMGKVIGITRSKPMDEQYDKANPIRNDESGFWQCPFCLRNDYAELSDVWAHFDSKECPGQATGVRLRLDNGVTGTIDTKMISDKEIRNPEERVQTGMTIHARILRINIEKFHVNLSSRSSDLLDKNMHFLPQKDYSYDFDLEDADRKEELDQKRKKNRQTYIKRIIVHPSFQNIDFAKAERLLKDMEVGEAIIRPSSKGTDHLTLTWKVYDGITQHVDIEEKDKDNAYSLGKTLFIGRESYEDLDEILARYVNPMACFAIEIKQFKYFQHAQGGKREVLESLLQEEKKKQPNKIHYYLAPSTEMPGKYALAYLPKHKVVIEYVTVTPEGIRYRKNMFRSLGSLLRWFKEHFKDPVAVPSSQASIRTPGSARTDGTPNINPAAIHRAAASMPAHLYNSLSAVTGQQTPYSSSMPPPPPPAAGFAYGNHTPSAAFRSTPGSSNWMPNQTPGQMAVPSTGAAGSSSGSRPASRSGDIWRTQAETWQRRTPRETQHTRTPAYATPGASSMMSISPTSSPAPAHPSHPPRRTSDHTPLLDEWN
jgi:transcription elongation factor SPT6